MRERLSALWVRNVIGAVVTAVAIGVLFVIGGMGESWSTYRRTVVPEAVVPSGHSGVADGRSWKLDAIRHLNRAGDYGPRLPAGTVLTVITVDRTGSPPDEICTGVITDGRRSWKSESIGGFSAPQPDGVTSLCNKPGLLQFTFLLPQDVVPTAMDVTTLGGQIMVRLLL